MQIDSLVCKDMYVKIKIVKVLAILYLLVF